MLIREGAARTEAIDRTLAMSLALIAGGLNAAVFYAAGFFGANMTGNLTTASDHLALGEPGIMLFFLTLVTAFIVGACVSALIIAAGVRRRIARIYACVLVIEAVALIALGLFAADIPDAYETQTVVLCLAFLMGLQNAVVTRISGARVRTTHISGMATDLGIELADLWNSSRHDRQAQVRRDRRRLSLHAVTILAFFAGGVGGVLLYQALGNGVMLVAGCGVALIAWIGTSAREVPEQRGD